MMAYQGATPWHQLGTRLDVGAGVEAALVAARLNWTVGLQPLYRLVAGPGGAMVPTVIEDRRAVVRDDGPYLGSVGSQFSPIQNADAFGVLGDACRDFGVTIEAAGGLGQGERCWMLARLPETITVTEGDTVNGYFLILNGHDGSTAYGARPTPIRVVCQNTLNAAMADGVDMIRIRHTKAADARLSEAKRLIDRMIGAMRETGDTFRALAERRMTPADIAAYVDAVFPLPKDEPVSDTLAARRKNVAALVWAGKGADLAGSDSYGSTAWAAYNAVCEYFDHVRPAEASSIAGTTRANESALFGGNAALKLLALRKARQLVAA